uniref:Serine-threonine/tyrosine-protein kinase catalytic domain-containing protein n=1 Tax=Rhizophagus irregularis (strain DAOM 181602 / DAOM 197198 / MUCL 43194) TaxID=747089 RepID=U9US59_RHIID
MHDENLHAHVELLRQRISELETKNAKLETEKAEIEARNAELKSRVGELEVRLAILEQGVTDRQPQNDSRVNGREIPKVSDKEIDDLIPEVPANLPDSVIDQLKQCRSDGKTDNAMPEKRVGNEGSERRNFKIPEVTSQREPNSETLLDQKTPYNQKVEQGLRHELSAYIDGKGFTSQSGDKTFDIQIPEFSLEAIITGSSKVTSQDIVDLFNVAMKQGHWCTTKSKPFFMIFTISRILAQENTPTKYAIKKFIDNKEVYLTKMVNSHANIIQFHGVTKIEDEERYSLVLDYAEGGTLRDYLRNNIIEWKTQIRVLFWDLASLIDDLEDNYIMLGEAIPNTNNKFAELYQVNETLNSIDNDESTVSDSEESEGSCQIDLNKLCQKTLVSFRR